METFSSSTRVWIKLYCCVSSFPSSVREKLFTEVNKLGCLHLSASVSVAVAVNKRRTDRYIVAPRKCMPMALGSISQLTDNHRNAIENSSKCIIIVTIMNTWRQSPRVRINNITCKSIPYIRTRMTYKWSHSCCCFIQQSNRPFQRPPLTHTCSAVSSTEVNEQSANQYRDGCLHSSGLSTTKLSLRVCQTTVLAHYLVVFEIADTLVYIFGRTDPSVPVTWTRVAYSVLVTVWPLK